MLSHKCQNLSPFAVIVFLCRLNVHALLLWNSETASCWQNWNRLATVQPLVYPWLPSLIGEQASHQRWPLCMFKCVQVSIAPCFSRMYRRQVHELGLDGAGEGVSVSSARALATSGHRRGSTALLVRLHSFANNCRAGCLLAFLVLWSVSRALAVASHEHLAP